MIETLPCGCCKTKPLQSNFLRIRNELFKGNVVFFDNPYCECCGIEKPENIFVGQLIYFNGLVRGEKYFLLEERTEELSWTLEEFKEEMNQMISDEFEFSYVNAKISLNGHQAVVKYLN